ncbi:hypothetical protein ACFQX6_11220 [Streptosporangium lutulentum]
MMKRPRLNVDQRQYLGLILDEAFGTDVRPEAARLVLGRFFAALSDWCEPDLFTLGYTGWREADRDRVREDLTEIRNQVGPMRLIVGFDPEKRTPTGGDMHAYDWGQEAPGVIVECLPAPWDIPELARSAGPYRNGAIVERVLAATGSKAMLAHLHPSSRGAAAPPRTPSSGAWT